MKIFLFFIALALSVSAQNKKKCNSNDEASLEDFNSITKCSIAPVTGKGNNKKSNILKVKVSTSRRRYLKKHLRGGVNKASSFHVGVVKGLKFRLLARSISVKEMESAKKFVEVDVVPVFSNCGELPNKSKLDCFQSEMISHINKFFYYPIDAINKNIQSSIWIRFVIDSNGNVGNVKTIGNPNIDTSQLEDVAKYVVLKLPRFSPALKNGKPIAVKYGFPINFTLEK